mgnify:CR=1 FL=1
MKAEEVNRLIGERRSVFVDQFSGQRVDDAIIDQLLENANWAPTHKLTEPWRFIVYTGEGLRKLATLQAEFYKKITTKDGSFKEERYQNLLKKPAQSSHIIVIGMKRDSRKSVPEIEEAGAVFCAIQNMYLTTAAYGVGGYLSTGGITYFEGAQALIGWGPEDKLIGFFHVGIPKNSLHKGVRKPVGEKIIWIRE